MIYNTEILQIALKALELPSLKTQAMLEQRDKAIASVQEALAHPETQCKWPTCQNEQYQNSLAEQVLQELYTGRPWTGCGDCDCIFACYEGKTRCIRVATLDYIEKLKTKP